MIFDLLSGNFDLVDLISLLVSIPVVLLSLSFHELAHGYVAMKLGDPTARYYGRITMNPLKHLDPIGALSMLLFGIGWAKPVPIDPRYYRDRKKGILLVSLAGPVTNFVLSFISLLLEGILIKFGSLQIDIVRWLCQMCTYSAIINLGLGLFNLVPIPPLDGSKIAGALSGWAAKLYWKFQRYWRIVLVICVATGILSRPLNWCNDMLVNAMWRFVVLILRL